MLCYTSMVLALKLFLTPLMIAAVTLAGRRWGPGVSGWVMGLPLTSGPVSLILAWQYGPVFAAHAATGTLGGQTSVCIFCFSYALAARRLAWLPSGLLAVSAFLVSTFVWNHFALSLLPTFIILLLIIFVLFRLFPDDVAAGPAQHGPAPRAPRWDIPARMLIAATFVVLLTTFAATLGPQLSGLLSPFPVFGLVLATFTYRQQGPQAAARLLRGVVLGSLAFGSFFLVAGALLPGAGAAAAASGSAAPPAAIVPIYLLAAFVALSINGFSLRLAR
jgi:hypothetical protein